MKKRWKVFLLVAILAFTNLGYQVEAKSNQEVTIIKGYSEGHEDEAVEYVSNSSFYVFKIGDKELSKAEKKKLQEKAGKETIQDLKKEYPSYKETKKTDQAGRLKIDLEEGYAYLIVEDLNYDNAMTIKGKKYKSAVHILNLFSKEENEIIVKPIEVKKETSKPPVDTNKPQIGPADSQNSPSIDQESPKTGDKSVWIWSVILILSLISTLSLRNKKEVKI